MLPEESEPAAVPLEQNLGFDDQHGLFPVRYSAGQHDQQAAVERRKCRVFHLALQDDELLS